ncbi:MAG: hypothetical protein IJ542_00370 [Clostridia bacterium]|nr:hypothetical protein [Clostridia bacterium]
MKIITQKVLTEIMSGRDLEDPKEQWLLFSSMRRIGKDRWVYFVPDTIDEYEKDSISLCKMTNVEYFLVYANDASKWNRQKFSNYDAAKGKVFVLLENHEQKSHIIFATTNSKLAKNLLLMVNEITKPEGVTFSVQEVWVNSKSKSDILREVGTLGAGRGFSR